MKLGLIKIAITTVGNKGLEDNISYEFGHSKTFTIIDIENGKIKSLEIIQNPAASLSHGRGPVIAKHLANMGVNIVISSEIGPGSLTMLNELRIEKIIVKPGQKVIDVLKEENLVN